MCALVTGVQTCALPIWLVAQQFAIALGTPFRTTAIITGVSQVTMVAVALATPYLIGRLGLAAVMLPALCALPIRGLIAGTQTAFWRSEERRLGTECASTCRSWWSAYT